MKHKLPLIMSIIVIVAVSACGAQATPTQDLVNAQNTAMAVVFTTVAKTQEAIPTSTLIPATATSTQTPAPTDTPFVSPTETLAEIPTLSSTTVAATPVASSNGTGDPCNKPLTISGGKPAKIKIDNTSGWPVTVSLYLQQTPFGDCGYKGYFLTKLGSILITDLIQGCYSFNALIDNPKHQARVFGSGCINNPDKWSITISKDRIMLQGK